MIIKDYLRRLFGRNNSRTSLGLPPFFDAVVAHISECAPSYSPQIRRVQAVRVRRCGVSTNPVFRVTLVDGDQEANFVAKWCPADVSNDEAAAERDHYRQFNESCSDTRLRCPQVVAHLSDPNVLVTEYEAAPTLLSLIHPMRSTAESLEAAVALAGEWLARFHSLCPSRSDEIAASTRIIKTFSADDWAGSGALLSAARLVLGSDIASTIGTIPGFLARKGAIDDGNMGTVHGDFGPSNILAGRERLVVLDAARQHSGIQATDVAMFWAGMTVSGRLRGWRQGTLNRISEKFLGSYSSSRPDFRVTRKLYGALAIASLMRSFARHCARWIRYGYTQHAAASLLRYVYATPFQHAVEQYESAGDVCWTLRHAGAVDRFIAVEPQHVAIGN